MKTGRSQHGMLNGAHVHETSLSVTFGALCIGTILSAPSECSKYLMFSLTFGAQVHEASVSVTFGASRRSVPLCLLETNLATWAAKAGQEFRNAPDPSGISAPRSPPSAAGHLSRPHREYVQTCQLVSAVAGRAMRM